MPQLQRFQTTCILQIPNKPPPPPWGRVGERAKQLPLKPTSPQPQQTLSLTLSRRRGNRVPQLQRFQTTCVLQICSKPPPPPWGGSGRGQNSCLSNQLLRNHSKPSP
ncbi:Uncharacterised protein [Neisseria meningitidis]|uniref:Uncharacterized protein n=1 Tax=Neisseria meningitidis TaxID=487 RepID=A0A378WCN9_NEIME|nr:Uncharacterised protein [Neisseria meningitidis]